MKMRNRLIENISEKVFNDFINEYYEDDFQADVNPEVKENASIYKTNFIIWYGTKGRSVLAPLDSFDETEGNIFKDGKVDQLVELINHSPEAIELETSYCIPYKLDLVQIAEILYSERMGDGEYSHINDNISTNNSDVDFYISYNNSVDEMPIFDEIEYNLYKVLEKYHMMIALGIKTMDEFKRDLIEFTKANHIDYDDAKQLYQYVKFNEKEAAEAIAENSGNLGDIRFQLRDGNHRFRACKKLGLTYMLCDLHLTNTNITLEEIAERFEVR